MSGIIASCPHCGCSDHYLFRAGAPCVQHAREARRVKCIKDCWMEGIPQIVENRCFCAGRLYGLIGLDSDGFQVTDDQGDRHWIGVPGETFFGEYFQVAVPR